MSEQIELHSTRNEVDKTFVGFSPNGGSIKPVHIAGGAQRVIYGKVNKSNNIKRMALVISKKGFTPKGNNTSEVHSFLNELGALENFDAVSDVNLEALRNTMRGRLNIADGNAKLAGLESNIRELRDINRIIITACGTSYYAGMVGEYMIEDLAGVPVEVEYASEFRYRNPIIKPGTLVLAISQSGETADTLAAMKEAHQKGATVLGICNGVGSSIARNSDGGVYLHAGPEIGVASTKAFSGQVLVLAMIALLLGRQRRVSFEHGMEIANAITKIPELVEETLKMNGAIRAIAEKYKDAKNFLYLGRHYNYPVAMEGALKLKEISYIHAEGYPAAEMKHGPIALIDENMPVVVIAPKDALFDKIISNIREIKARGGKVIAVTTQDCSPLDEFADDLIRVPTTLPMLMPILTCVPLQLLAYHVATLRGNNVDQPRNLAKSVTVE